MCAREVQKMSCAEEADYTRKDEGCEAEQEPEESKKAEEAAPGGGDEEDEEKSKKTGAAAAGGGDDAAGKEVLMRTMCKFHPQGKCTRGDLCGYAHDPRELGEKVKNPQGLFSSLCKYWEKSGRCHKTSECEFAHGVEELGKKKPAVPAKQKK